MKSSIRRIYQDKPAVILVELLIALLIVAGHMAGILPFTSTVSVFLFAWLTLFLQGKKWKDFGLKKPDSWKRAILLALTVGIIYQAISLYLIEPILSNITGELPDVSVFRPLEGNTSATLLWIFLGWVLAGFGEEMVYRGYFLHRFSDLFRNEKTRLVFGILASSFLFGSVHMYQGLSGMIAVGLFGLMFALVYYISGRNLWAPILAHGITDTVGFVMIFFGIYPGM